MINRKDIQSIYYATLVEDRGLKFDIEHMYGAPFLVIYAEIPSFFTARIRKHKEWQTMCTEELKCQDGP